MNIDEILINNICSVLKSGNDEKINIFDLILDGNVDSIKTFITKYPGCLENIICIKQYELSIESCDIVEKLYTLGMTKFICKKMVDDCKIMYIISEFIYNSLKSNDVGTLKYLLKKYSDKITECDIKRSFRRLRSCDHYVETIHILCNHYDISSIVPHDLLLVNNNIKVLQYMFGKYCYNYISELFFYDTWYDSIKPETMEILISDVLKKKLLNDINCDDFFTLICRTNTYKYFYLFQKYEISMNKVNKQFKIFCENGHYDGAHELKKRYPDINTNDVICDEKYQDLYHWLNNDCPINILTKSARK